MLRLFSDIDKAFSIFVLKNFFMTTLNRSKAASFINNASTVTLIRLMTKNVRAVIPDLNIIEYSSR